MSLPIDCELGKDCYIQQYVDKDNTPNAVDFTCGPLSYDGHKGTDFALPSLATMVAGVDVLAAAPGQVVRLRDGEEDAGAQGFSEGRDCGNGMVIAHQGGWSTQYCHLKKGSVLVQEGETVKQNQPLGQVGLSGRTEFPHLHVTLRRDNKIVDPFAPDNAESCNPANEGSHRQLWATPIAYKPGGLISVGFADKAPSFDDVKAGIVALPANTTDVSALVFFIYGFGAQKGDDIRLRLVGPQGEVVAQEVTIERNRALFFRAAGRRRPADNWPAGEYIGTAMLLRDNQLIDSISYTVTLAANDR